MRKKILFAVMVLLTMATGNIWGGNTPELTPYVIYDGNGTLYFLCHENAELTEITLGDNTIQLSTDDSNNRNCWREAEVTNTGSTNPGWYSKNSSVTSVVIEESFKNAEINSCYGWFYGCKNLTSLNLSNLNTSNVTNMSQMFNYCQKLASITFGEEFNTSNVTSMSNMFRTCSVLASLDLSHFNTSNVTDMQCMFYYCQKLTSLDLGNFDTSNVTNVANMFNYCNSLTSLDLSNFDTSNVTSMSGMFSGCNMLTSLDLSNFDTSSVTSMFQMFNGCKSLTSLDLRNFNTLKVKNMGQMFKSCQGLTSITFGENFDTSIVTGMAAMFNGCNNLTSLDLSSFKTSNVTDMANMFNGCNNLTSLDLRNFDTSKVTNMSYMFYGCNNKDLTSLNLSNFKTENVTNMSSMFYGCKSLTSLDLSNFKISSKTTMSEMFKNCQGLTSITFGESFETLNWTQMSDMSYMFYGCNSLTSLDLSSFNTSKVDNMSYMFHGCDKLTSLDLSSFNTQFVENMSYMFCGCNNLTSLDLSSFNTSSVTNMSYMFYGCNSLTSLDLNNFNTSNVTNVANMFADCSNLRLVDFSKATIPNFSTFENVIDNSILTVVPSGTTVTGDGANVVVGDECENFEIKNDQLLLNIPYSFTAKKITVNRNFTAGNPHTLCLPFAMDDAKEYGTFYAYEEYDESNKSVTFSALDDATATEANKPYLFVPSETLENGFVINKPTLVEACTEETSEDREFIGVYKKKTFTQEEADEGVYGWANGEFRRAGEGASVDACRAYLKLQANIASDAPARLSVRLGGGTTGISSAIDDADCGADAPAYNMQGQRVSGSYKGVVIRKGKKMILK